MTVTTGRFTLVWSAHPQGVEVLALGRAHAGFVLEGTATVIYYWAAGSRTNRLVRARCLRAAR
jgi:hypothetical protein